MIKITASQERDPSSLRKKQIKRRGKLELIQRREPVGLKQTLELIRHLNLSDLNLSVSFLTKKKKDPGRDMTNAGTYPACELIRLELIRLGQ